MSIHNGTPHDACQPKNGGFKYRHGLELFKVEKSDIIPATPESAESVRVKSPEYGVGVLPIPEDCFICCEPIKPDGPQSLAAMAMIRFDPASLDGSMGEGVDAGAVGICKGCYAAQDAYHALVQAIRRDLVDDARLMWA